MTDNWFVITDEEIENYHDDPFANSVYDKKETQKLMEEEWRGIKRNSTRTVMTNDKMQILEQAFMADFTIEEACHQAWINIATFNHYYNENEEFRERINASKDFAFRMWKKKIMQAISSSDFNDYEFILKWLRMRQPKLYWEQQEFVQHQESLTAEDNMLLQEILIDKGSSETLDEIKIREEKEAEQLLSEEIDLFLEDNNVDERETDINLSESEDGQIF